LQDRCPDEHAEASAPKIWTDRAGNFSERPVAASLDRLRPECLSLAVGREHRGAVLGDEVLHFQSGSPRRRCGTKVVRLAGLVEEDGDAGGLIVQGQTLATRSLGAQAPGRLNIPARG
jgi:hypothetical protein